MAQPPTFDLQSHSTHSDGALPPQEVVARAHAAGVELFALSDHDTVGGVAEAIEAGERHGVKVVPAIELSSLLPDGPDVHILGYGIDHESHDLLAALETYRADREARGERMAQALIELGWHLDRTEIDARARQGLPIGRPHLAQAAFAHPANAQRIADENLEKFSDLLVAYLIEGAPAFRTRTMPATEQAIDAIHAAGGVAVWAHPFFDFDEAGVTERTLRALHGEGVDGVEAFYITHTREQTHALCDLAAELGLITTGSADFHGPDHPHFHAFRAFELHGREPVLGPIA